MATVTVSRKLKALHPVVAGIARNLADIDAIHFVRVTPGLLLASSEVTGGRVQTPVTKVGHPTAIGVSILIDLDAQDLIFDAITSAVRGYGNQMVGAVLKDLPDGWNVFVGIDWSDGFWEKMCRRHPRIVIL